MARRNNRARNTTLERRIAAEVAKAIHPNMAALARQSSAQPQARSLGHNLADVINGQTTTRGFMAQTMPRNPRDESPFGPLNPLGPAALDLARPDTGRPGPRLTEYPVAWNVPTGDHRLISWATLREAARAVDIIRACIEVRKKDIRGLQWAWTVTDEAVTEAYQADPARGKSDIANELREKWSPQIKDLTQRWLKPWPSQGLDFGTWVNGVMEDHLVLDAVAIYPQTTYAGELIALEILDGATIKPLLDWRGARPTPPFPAYQQILYGFPRGEWTATVDEVDADGQPIISSGFLADQLYYFRENYRSFSPYGLSAVERALMSARLYLKRQGWMLAEYEFGSVPQGLMELTESTPITPQERVEWESSLNDELSGQTAARHRMKVMFPGMTPHLMPSVDERYKPDYDLFLIKLLAMPFGVPISKLGFTETRGLGASGLHEQQSQNAEDQGETPDASMLAGLINDLSQRYMGAPAELNFVFVDPDNDEQQVLAGIRREKIESAQLTINEARQEDGQPILNIPEADMPFILSGTGPVFLEGSSAPKPEPGQLPGSGAVNAGADNADEPAAGDDVSKYVGPDHDIATAVVSQLADDYPPDALTWVQGAHWTGPKMVPVGRLDMDDADSWSASKEPDRVAQFAKAMKRGKMKPAVLVQEPGDGQLKIVDGHHRTLAAISNKTPLLAYVGKVGSKTGPWDGMHSAQNRNAFDLADAPVSAPPALDTGKALGAVRDRLSPVLAEMDGAAKATEFAAYKRFVKRGHARPFEWVHHTAAEIAELTKASEPDPKAQAAVPPPDSRWPAWAVDALLAAVIATQLRKAVGAILNPADTARDLIDWAKGQPTPLSAAAVRSWLRSRGVHIDLGNAVNDALIQGAAIGSRSAVAVLAHMGEAGESPRLLEPDVSVTVDWGGWTPGNVAAARKILSEDGMDIGDLLRDVGIDSIEANRLDEVAAVLADALEQGRGVTETATALQGVLNDGNWAEMTAWTEINRAQSAAALDTYRRRNVPGHEWFTAADQRVCPVCEGNELQGPIAVGEAFKSGQTHPPAHPRCRCATLPVLHMPDFDAAKSAQAVATGNEGNARRLHDYWVHGNGLAKWATSPHPWTTLYHHLLKYIHNPDEAKRTAAQWYHDALGTWPGQHHGHKG